MGPGVPLPNVNPTVLVVKSPGLLMVVVTWTLCYICNWMSVINLDVKKGLKWNCFIQEKSVCDSKCLCFLRKLCVRQEGVQVHSSSKSRGRGTDKTRSIKKHHPSTRRTFPQIIVGTWNKWPTVIVSSFTKVCHGLQGDSPRPPSVLVRTNS